MIVGLSVGAFTTLHVIISLIGIASGLLVLLAMLAGREPPGLAGLFLCTTILTSATGFLFHSAKIGPPHVVGAISLVVLALALIGLYLKHLNGPWRAIYVISAVLSLYFNAFVGVVQAFGKIGFLKALAPTGSEPPFAIAQGLVLLLFAALGFLAVRKFHPAVAASA